MGSNVRHRAETPEEPPHGALHEVELEEHLTLGEEDPVGREVGQRADRTARHFRLSKAGGDVLPHGPAQELEGRGGQLACHEQGEGLPGPES